MSVYRHRSGIVGMGVVLLVIVLLSSALSLTSGDVGYLDAVKDFGAVNNGTTLTTSQLQSAINAALTQHKPLFIPAGTYLVDKTLLVDDNSERDEQTPIIAGSSLSADNRTVILLKEGTFPTPNMSNPGFVIKLTEWSGGFTDRFNAVIKSIDIKIQPNNAGAVGLRWRGAEGCAVFDVHIDVTGGWKGIWEVPGSGGSCANISVTGGRIGVDIRNLDESGDGAQPTPTFTDVTFEGQREAAILTHSTRGAVTVTGGTFLMAPGVPVLKLKRMTTFKYSPGGNPVLTDCRIAYTAPGSNIVAAQEDSRHQSIFFDNVYVENASFVMKEDTEVPSNPSGWRRFKLLAYNSGPRQFGSGTHNEPIYLQGIMHPQNWYTDFEDDVAPPRPSHSSQLGQHISQLRNTRGGQHRGFPPCR